MQHFTYASVSLITYGCNTARCLRDVYTSNLNRLFQISLYKLLFCIATAIVFLIRLYILLWHGQLQTLVAFEPLVVDTISIPLHKPCSFCVQFSDLLFNNIYYLIFKYNNLHNSLNLSWASQISSHSNKVKVIVKLI